MGSRERVSWPSCGSPVRHFSSTQRCPRGERPGRCLRHREEGYTYTYDAENQRVEKDGSSGATEFVYFDGRVVAELNPSSGAWTDYINPGGGILAEVPGSQTATPLY